jgi:hypothetical protein
MFLSVGMLTAFLALSYVLGLITIPFLVYVVLKSPSRLYREK